MFSSKTPSVFGFVIIRPATSSSTTVPARRDRPSRVSLRLDVLDRVAGDGGGRGIGAVRRIGNQDLLARIAARFEQRADQQDAGQLAMRAGRRLQRHGVHAGDLGERVFEAAP